MRALPLLLIVVAACTVSRARSAQASSVDFAELFDTPLKRETVPSHENHPEVTCIWFADQMVRELNTDGPGGGPSTVLPIRAGADRPSCDDGQYRGLRPEQTRDGLLLGRKGRFMMFYSYAAAGATPFVIVDATDLRVIYSDTMAAKVDTLKTMDATPATLHLRFTREVDAPCSLLLDTAACWMMMMRSKAIPPILATPSATLCAEPYRRMKDPPTAPSIVLYDVDITVQPDSRAHVLSRGVIRCEGPS